jgi:hypothetical protein
MNPVEASQMRQALGLIDEGAFMTYMMTTNAEESDNLTKKPRPTPADVVAALEGNAAVTTGVTTSSAVDLAGQSGAGSLIDWGARSQLQSGLVNLISRIDNK